MAFQKDPQAVLDYTFDWSAWLAAGETITAATVTIADTAGGTSALVKDSQSFTGTTVTAWLSAGAVDHVYSAVCHVTTSAARQDDRTIYIAVVNR